MNIAIIGGGFTGLTAAYELAKRGHRVTLFEKDNVLGGLAHGFKRPGWDLPRAKLGLSGVEGSRGWHLEAAYHHLFTNDRAILGLIKELGLSDKLILKRPVTATLWNGRMYPLDSPLHLLRFPGIPLIDRLRTGALLASIKINPFWQPFEWLTAKRLFLAVGGRAAWETIWEPLMIGKFGPYADRVAASWLWARIKKRTPSLYYISGGFHTLVTALEQAIKQHGGIIHIGIKLDKFDQLDQFDRTLLTIPTPSSIPHLHAQVLILETKEPILQDTLLQARKRVSCEANNGVYWLNVTDRSFPFLAVVAHTNMIDKKHYGNRHITYFGNYLPYGHPYLSMTKEQLLKKFLPFIKRLSPTSHFSLLTSHLFTGVYAQPVHELHYCRKAPKLETPTKGVYLANMDSIYPWDRGTNYAVELGKHAAETIHKSG